MPLWLVISLCGKFPSFCRQVFFMCVCVCLQVTEGAAGAGGAMVTFYVVDDSGFVRRVTDHKLLKSRRTKCTFQGIVVSETNC